MRAQKIAIFLVYGFLLLASGAFLFGCGDDSASTAPQGPQPVAGPLGQAAVGNWMADTTLAFTVGGVTLNPTVVIDDTLRADSTFSAALRIRNLMGNDVVGSIYERRGKWSISGEVLILAPSICLQSDTTSSTMGPLPFSFSDFVANAKIPVPCGAPDTVRTRPQTDGHWRVPMNVNLPGVATGSWVLDFVRQP